MLNYSHSHYWISQSNLTHALKGLLEVKLFYEIFWPFVIPIPTFTHNQAEHQIVLQYSHIWTWLSCSLMALTSLCGWAFLFHLDFWEIFDRQTEIIFYVLTEAGQKCHLF